MTRMNRIWLTLPLLAGCGVEAAPEDIDGLTRWLWVNHEAASDREVLDAVAQLDLALDGDSLEELTGELTRLGPEDLAHLELPADTDPAEARGWFLAYSYPCTLSELQPILYHLAQDELYEGVYDHYNRDYIGDIEAYKAQESTTIGWQAELGATLLNKSYTERLFGGLRYVDDAERPALLGRVWIPEPASFEDPDWAFDQDYQVEAWYERAPGEIVHLYGIWRHMALGSLDTESDGLVNTTLNNMAAWDDETAELCAAGRP
ncbi:MAG: hypothetical protein H6741_05355 [Alphaproteobacteria bacterium]|nr:hypothetical protein [Alphaproteobacteria bacterium]MCB9792133.1 hypothetical protein [Alphaproteobacteria bacterium]